MKNADNYFLISSFVPTPDDLDKKPKSLHVLTEHSGSEWAGGQLGRRRRTCSFVILHPSAPQKKLKEKSVYSLFFPSSLTILDLQMWLWVKKM